MNPTGGRRSTKERILDAAERLFAREGYRGASLRAVTGLAGANLAAANYHFGTKRGLLEAVFARRLEPFHHARVSRLAETLAAARRAGRRPTAREVLAVIVETSLVPDESTPGALQFASLIGRSFFDPDITVQKTFTVFMRPTFEATLNALAETLPEIPRETLAWRLQFTIGALARVQHLTRRGAAALTCRGRATPPATLNQELVSFVEGGMHAPWGGCRSCRTAPRPPLRSKP